MPIVRMKTPVKVQGVPGDEKDIFLFLKMILAKGDGELLEMRAGGNLRQEELECKPARPAW